MKSTKYLLLFLSLSMAAVSCKNEPKAGANSQNSTTNTQGLETEVEKEEKGLFSSLVEKVKEANPLADNSNNAIKEVDGKVDFTYKLEKGQVLDFKLDNTTDGIIKDPKSGQKQSTQSLIKKHYSVKVLDKTATGYILRFTLTHDYGRNQVDGKTTLEMSNLTKTAPKGLENQLKFLKANVGNYYDVEIDNKGKVIKVSGVDQYNANLKKSLGALYNPAIEKQLNASINKEVVQKMFDGYMITFPVKANKVGASWDDNKTNNTQDINETINLKYTLKEVGQETAKISITGTESQKGQMSMTNQGLTRSESINLNGTIVGEIVYDAKTGWIKTFSHKESTSGLRKMSLSAQGKSQSQSMNITSTKTTKINL
ncbi:MAG: hypothetical protein C4K58_06230 [Flavobacteriaceae bacterium]|nr:MAG: hypothetical protein C4K58_06230 [Flavobacteriaceae bacterium]